VLTRLPAGVDPAAAAAVSDNLTVAYVCATRGLRRHPDARALVVSSLRSLGLFAVDQALGADVGAEVDAGTQHPALRGGHWRYQRRWPFA